jgi:hypothetical protein
MTPAIDVGHRVALQAEATDLAAFFGPGDPRARALTQPILSDSCPRPAKTQFPQNDPTRSRNRCRLPPPEREPSEIAARRARRPSAQGGPGIPKSKVSS